MRKTVLAIVLLSVGFVAFPGCGSREGSGVVAQPHKTAEQLQAEQEAYAKQMDADAKSDSLR
ncbi:hypothetical protein [Novipirellula sp.]|uniref:hypothetical protein n=1 Tax=Novipirellula sp. TaxID=2795430 RepID=UPI003562FAB5